MDRNTEHLHRERAARDEALLERDVARDSLAAPIPRAYPNAADDHHHVVLTHAQVPGLGASSPTTAVFESTRRGTITSATRTPPRAPAWPPDGDGGGRAGAPDELAAEDAARGGAGRGGCASRD